MSIYPRISPIDEEDWSNEKKAERKVYNEYWRLSSSLNNYDEDDKKELRRDKEKYMIGIVCIGMAFVFGVLAIIFKE